MPRIIAAVVLSAFTACFLWLRKHDEPRRDSLQALQNLGTAVQANPSAILDDIVLPRTLASRTHAERTEFLVKVLRGEISEAGIAALRRHGSFGPLTKLFPNEAESWTKQAGVNPDNCVAFKMERAGVRAEVVLVREGEAYRVVRCNNVKQMAGGY